MTERKFTDEEVIRALEVCSDVTTESCVGCPFLNCCKQSSLKKLALDLINRQRADIEKWQLAYDCADSALRELSVTRSEAIKEFAEKLKEEQEYHVDECDRFVGFVAVSRIDRLVKEMTEGEQ